MRRDVVPRVRTAREGGVRRAATDYGVAPAFGKGAVSAALLPAMRCPPTERRVRAPLRLALRARRRNQHLRGSALQRR
jgi:hypothetical protein